MGRWGDGEMGRWGEPPQVGAASLLNLIKLNRIDRYFMKKSQTSGAY
ncbi:hypothetical protein [Moorena producens]